MNQLEALKRLSIVVADTGDFESIRDFHPRDATTNPSLVLKAVQLEAYEPLLARAIAQTKGAPLSDTLDALLVAFGVENCVDF
jgi:transaldolase